MMCSLCKHYIYIYIKEGKKALTSWKSYRNINERTFLTYLFFHYQVFFAWKLVANKMYLKSGNSKDRMVRNNNEWAEKVFIEDSWGVFRFEGQTGKTEGDKRSNIIAGRVFFFFSLLFQPLKCLTCMLIIHGGLSLLSAELSLFYSSPPLRLIPTCVLASYAQRLFGSFVFHLV